MEDRMIQSTRKAYANATLDQICEDRNHFSRFKSVGAQETVKLLQQIIEEKLAEVEASPSSWSKANTEKPKPLTPAEERKREEQRIERETQGGRFLPRPREP